MSEESDALDAANRDYRRPNLAAQFLVMFPIYATAAVLVYIFAFSDSRADMIDRTIRSGGFVVVAWVIAFLVARARREDLLESPFIGANTENLRAPSTEIVAMYICLLAFLILAFVGFLSPKSHSNPILTRLMTLTVAGVLGCSFVHGWRSEVIWIKWSRISRKDSPVMFATAMAIVLLGFVTFLIFGAAGEVFKR